MSLCQKFLKKRTGSVAELATREIHNYAKILVAVCTCTRKFYSNFVPQYVNSWRLLLHSIRHLTNILIGELTPREAALTSALTVAWFLSYENNTSVRDEPKQLAPISQI